jgi:hypothetical protein
LETEIGQRIRRSGTGFTNTSQKTTYVYKIETDPRGNHTGFPSKNRQDTMKTIAEPHVIDQKRNFPEKVREPGGVLRKERGF